MKTYVGLDVSQKETSICVVDADGRKIWAGKSKSTPEAIADALRTRAPGVARVGLETGTLSTWHYHGLQALGVPIFCLDARQAHAALSTNVNKTDTNDAEGLAQLVRMGWFRPVHVKSMASHLRRTLMQTRWQLVGMRRDISNQIRGSLKTFGIVLGKGGGGRFERMVKEQIDGRADLAGFIGPLLEAWRALRAQVIELDKRIMREAKADPVVRLLATAPGVGATIAMTYAAVIDDPRRFAHSRNVGAHLGLTPRRYQSGEVDRQGHISKNGDQLARHYLFEAAGVLLTRITRRSDLKSWGQRLAKRVGFTKAKVAVARKLAVILHRMWIVNEPFRWSTGEEVAR